MGSKGKEGMLQQNCGVECDLYLNAMYMQLIG